jgi:hypothetical protein
VCLCCDLAEQVMQRLLLGAAAFCSTPLTAMPMLQCREYMLPQLLLSRISLAYLPYNVDDVGWGGEGKSKCSSSSSSGTSSILMIESTSRALREIT